MIPPACPLCDRSADPLHAPFCSPGCRNRDLLQWLGEGYRLPGPPADDGDGGGDGLDSPDRGR